MLDNLTLIAVIIILVYMVGFGFYIAASRGQRRIKNDLDALEQRLPAEE